MRPLSRPPWEARFADVHPSLAVEHAFGRFCAICERRLVEAGVAWDVAAQAPAARWLDGRSWADVLPLCARCAEAAAGGELAAPEAPLRPDRTTTFRTIGGSPLTYELRTLKLAGPGAVDSPPTAERAIVVGHTPTATATIAHYALNTAFHRAGRDVLVLPEGLSLARLDVEVDPRLWLRTQAWHQAERAAVALRPPRHEDAERVQLIGELSGTTGFWSVWQTVLARRHTDAAAAARIRTHGLFASTLIEAP